MLSRPCLWLHLLLLFLSGCSIVPQWDIDLPGDSPTQRQWLFFFYMNGDNNLEEEALDLIHSFENIPWENQPVSLLILLDRSPFYTKADGNWDDTRLFSVNTDLSNDLDIGSISINLNQGSLQLPGELNLGDPAVLQEFLLYGMEEFPARHYGLILWDHGDGWRGSWGSDDAALNDRQETAELGRALDGLELDVLAFDYSQGLGAMLEVAFEVKDNCDYFISSQNEDPLSWNHGDIFTSLFETDFSVGNYHESVLNSYKEQYQDSGLPRTISILDCSKIDGVNLKLNLFCDELEKLIQSSGDPERVIELLNEEAETFRYTPGDVNVDIRSMALVCAEEFGELEEAAVGLEEAVDGAVVGHWEQAEFFEECGGVSLFLGLSNESFDISIPEDCGYLSQGGLQDLLAFSSVSNWPDLLQKLWEKEL